MQISSYIPQTINPSHSHAQTHRFANKHTQRTNIHKKPIGNHLRHLAVHHLAAERLPHDRAVRDCVHGHAGAGHHFGLADFQNSDDSHDHHGSGVGSLFLLVEQFADRVGRFGAEV
jgi:hypothetical protein